MGSEMSLADRLDHTWKTWGTKESVVKVAAASPISSVHIDMPACYGASPFSRAASWEVPLQSQAFICQEWNSFWEYNRFLASSGYDKQEILIQKCFIRDFEIRLEVVR